MIHTKQLISGLIGCAIGIVIAVLWLTPKHTVSELRNTEREYFAQKQLEEDRQEQSAMQGDCENGMVKKTPTGKIIQCVNRNWSLGNRTVVWESVSDNLQHTQSAMTRKMVLEVKPLDYETLRRNGLLPAVNK